MDCLSPILVKNKYFGIRANEYQYHRVPCGRCEACVARRRSQWFTRLKFHQEDEYYSCFVTLTYDDEHLPEGFNVCKKDVQDYHKRLRMALGENVKNFKYYLTSEYGAEGIDHRPHYHAIYFGISPKDWSKIEDSWQKGFVVVDNITDARLRYVTGYIIEKYFVPDGREPLFNLISKGLGAHYVDKFADWHHASTIADRCYVPYFGQKLAMPRYYKEKLYSSREQREYAQLMSDKADERIEEGIRLVGRSEYYRRMHSSASAYIDKVRKTHKKKKL